eukprot:CAMPEP_0203901886 /NCGR_PEP_ID=MMETSP0359-20131031/43974_1 /ASSEMBLY_ACC=CAM_ASM_000338 /TAXON_ID=268821 /ORGANISM="Scrippsiella Hangoei, Strain SHTV-5" /LENGTH=941 /DNA_ID=CAMNT_0050825609 /DNA_START=38 /DNA_END=2863 /DNA_ORIENTATION=+
MFKGTAYRHASSTPQMGPNLPVLLGAEEAVPLAVRLAVFSSAYDAQRARSTSPSEPLAKHRFDEAYVATADDSGAGTTARRSSGTAQLQGDVHRHFSNDGATGRAVPAPIRMGSHSPSVGRGVERRHSAPAPSRAMQEALHQAAMSQARAAAAVAKAGLAISAAQNAGRRSPVSPSPERRFGVLTPQQNYRSPSPSNPGGQWYSASGRALSPSGEPTAAAQHRTTGGGRPPALASPTPATRLAGLHQQPSPSLWPSSGGAGQAGGSPPMRPPRPQGSTPRLVGESSHMAHQPFSHQPSAARSGSAPPAWGQWPSSAGSSPAQQSRQLRASPQPQGLLFAPCTASRPPSGNPSPSAARMIPGRHASRSPLRGDVAGGLGRGPLPAAAAQQHPGQPGLQPPALTDEADPDSEPGAPCREARAERLAWGRTAVPKTLSSLLGSGHPEQARSSAAGTPRQEMYHRTPRYDGAEQIASAVADAVNGAVAAGRAAGEARLNSPSPSSAERFARVAAGAATPPLPGPIVGPYPAADGGRLPATPPAASVIPTTTPLSARRGGHGSEEALSSAGSRPGSATPRQQHRCLHRPEPAAGAGQGGLISALSSAIEHEVAGYAQRRLEREKEVSASKRHREDALLLSRLIDLLQPPRGPRRFGRREVRRPKSTADDSDVLFEEITLEEAIGAGSFGAVFKGRCRGEVVAVKKCKVDDPKDADMLLMEVRYLQKLRHPRLVSFLGCCNRPPHVLMLIELMEGGSLHALLFKSKRPVSFSTKSRMAQQVAEGLTYLHDVSIVHRDLKTMNIVLDAELNCKICDFGLTITLENTHVTVRSLQGSPRYMAPEQFESTARITEKVDIWQMGCVLLELFCLKVPFADAKGVQQVATELLIRRRPPPVPTDADPRARVLVQACLRIDAKLRPGADVLEQALSTLREACGPSDDAPNVQRC